MGNTGIVLAFEDQEIHPGITRSAHEHGWPVVRVPHVRAAMREVLRRRATVVVVQVVKAFAMQKVVAIVIDEPTEVTKETIKPLVQRSVTDLRAQVPFAEQGRLVSA